MARATTHALALQQARWDDELARTTVRRVRLKTPLSLSLTKRAAATAIALAAVTILIPALAHAQDTQSSLSLPGGGGPLAQPVVEGYRLPAPAQPAQPEPVRQEAVATATPETGGMEGEARTLDRLTRKNATRWEVAYQLASIADAATTLDCLRRKLCNEGNPLFGRNPSTAKLLGIKAATGLAHWLVFARIRARDPQAAQRFATVSFIVQAGIVGANLRFTFRGSK